MTPTPTVIHFTCHACGMPLTVPMELAGASGPCPGCGSMITSPKPELAAQGPAAVPALSPAPAPPGGPQPSPQPGVGAPGPGPSLLPLGQAAGSGPFPGYPTVGPGAAHAIPSPAAPLGALPAPPPTPVPVPKALDPHPTIVTKEAPIWPTSPDAIAPGPGPAAVASPLPPWPQALSPQGPSHPAASGGRTPGGVVGAPENAHPVLSHVLQAPSVLPTHGPPPVGHGAPSPLQHGLPHAPGANPGIGAPHPLGGGSLLPLQGAGAPAGPAMGLGAGVGALPAPGYNRPANPELGTAKTRLPVMPPSGSRRQVRSAPTGRRGAMFATLLMALLVLLGIGWFFRDQIRVTYITYTLQHAPEEEAGESPAPTPPAVPAPTFSPTAPPPGAEAPSGSAGSSRAAAPSPMPAAPPQASPAPAPAVSVVSSAPEVKPAAPSVAKVQPPVSGPARLEPPQAMPPTAPPVTVLPPLPVTAEDRKTMDAPPPSIRKSEQPVSLGPNSAPARIFENATPESQGAVDALKQFLAAPNWNERQKVVQTADKVRPLMEQYYHQNPDGPIAVRQIQLMRHDKTPNTGGPPHCVFQVSGGDLKQPLPVMVEEEGNSWKVDWLTFTEFKDELLQRFLESYQDEPKRFHVMMRRTHYFDDDIPGLDKLTCFEIQPPMPGFTGHVFARRAAPLSRDLDRYVGWEVSKAAAIVEIQWRKEGGQQWVELTGVPQYNWRNPAAAPAPVKAELVE